MLASGLRAVMPPPRNFSSAAGQIEPPMLLNVVALCWNTCELKAPRTRQSTKAMISVPLALPAGICIFHSTYCSAGAGGTTLHESPPHEPIVEQNPRLELGHAHQTFFMQALMLQDLAMPSLSTTSRCQFKLRALHFNIRISWM